MEVLAVITARGNSKRLPRKNLKNLLGKPLIAYTIESALKSKILTKVILSSDDDEIMKTARQYGAEVPFKRPDKLARDDTPSIDVIIHAVTFLEDKEDYSPDIVVILQPTSPLRTAEDIDNALQKHIETGADSVTSVVKANHWHPLQAKKIENDILYDYYLKENEGTRHQDLPSVYFRNGAFYSVKRDVLINEHSLYGKTTRPYIMPVEKSIDIDTEVDFRMAESLMQEGSAHKSLKKINGNSVDNQITKMLEAVPRLVLANLPTPLEKLNNINNQFNDITIFMKRDDLTGHCFGGNKERKLEFIMADALIKKATVVVTVGALQSNHCRMTTAIANKLHLKSELILIENDASKKGGNYFLDKLMGAKIHTVKVNEVGSKIEEVMKYLRDTGEVPYFIEGGGHNALGAIGYVYAINELKNQTEKMGISSDYLVLPTGTGTTQAGLVLGAGLFKYDIKIIGISVAREKGRCFQEITNIIKDTEEFLNIESTNYHQQVKVYDEYIGKGYGSPTEESTKMLNVMAEEEGLIIDPVYNAKAIAGMFDLISKKRLSGNVLYLNTGGGPALFTGEYLNQKI